MNYTGCDSVYTLYCQLFFISLPTCPSSTFVVAALPTCLSDNGDKFSRPSELMLNDTSLAVYLRAETDIHLMETLDRGCMSIHIKLCLSCADQVFPHIHTEIKGVKTERERFGDN